MFDLDPIHEDMFSQEITQAVWRDKYRFGSEAHPFDSFERVVNGVYAKSPEGKGEALAAMKAGLWCPAGRIQAGAGTPKRVTQINCYVMATIPDSLEGIAQVLKESMLTMQQGGGIGLDFSTLRPKGAPLLTTGEGATASGPVSYMDLWNSMCSTIMSAGYRRGAMMAVLTDDHPDIEEFIFAKKTQGRLTNFNVSVLVSDRLIEAVRRDAKWDLQFNGKVYRSINARELWDKITFNTYEYSEPGVIFIDRINSQNNLSYCEEIRATNPCGEQPLPPYGACNLGAINLARLVDKPFTNEANLNKEYLRELARIGVRFLDNVIDTTHYPLEQQKKEEEAKRRIGLGITGLANAMMQMQIRYGTGRATAFTREVMEVIRDAAYGESIALASQRGLFKLFEAGRYTKAPFVNSLPKTMQTQIRNKGIRNGVILTIAPTGTTSLYYGNISSGLEPVFAFYADRNVRQPDNTFKTYESVEDYGYHLYRKMFPDRSHELPSYMVKASDLSVSAHIGIQAACQEYVDASISKTINCPESMTFADFKEVYAEAYEKGCKGVTTYRPSPVRGAILSESKEDDEEDFDIDLDDEDIISSIPPRPQKLRSTTYKIKWPSVPQAFYITISDIGEPPRPYEIFISSKSARFMEWTTALCLMITAIFKRGGDISFVGEELKQVISANEMGWVGGKPVASIVAQIGQIIEQHINSLVEAPKVEIEDEDNEDPADDSRELEEGMSGDFCPSCGLPTLIFAEGCSKCLSCDYSDCG